jgi:1-deoxy-D-xylulose 5-phosphate reductoisomerase
MARISSAASSSARIARPSCRRAARAASSSGDRAADEGEEEEEEDAAPSANEEAAEAFLGGRIRFPAIVRTIADVLGAADQWAAQPATVEDVLDAQQWARQRARDAIDVAAQEVVSNR